MSYWDISTLVKLYAKEPDSAVFENYLVNMPGSLLTSRITLYETSATFRRKESEGILQAGAALMLYNELLQDVAAGDVRLIELGANTNTVRCSTCAPNKLPRFCSARSTPFILPALECLAKSKLWRPTSAFETPQNCSGSLCSRRERGNAWVLFRPERGKDFAGHRKRIENNRIVDSSSTNGVAIDVQGATEAVVLSGNEIAETREPADRIAVRLGAETKAIQVQSNQISGFATAVKQLSEPAPH